MKKQSELRLVGTDFQGSGFEPSGDDALSSALLEDSASPECQVAMVLEDLQADSGLTDLELLRAVAVWQATMIGCLLTMPPRDGGLG